MRKRSAEKESEYQADRAFALHLARSLDELAKRDPAAWGPTSNDGISWQHHTGPRELGMGPALAEGIANIEQLRPAQAHAGLKMAIQGLLEMTRDFSRDLVAALDAELRGHGLQTLSVVRMREWKTISKVLSRGRIKDDVEYYLVMERLNDVSTSGLADEERSSLNGVVAEYEARGRKDR